MHKPYYILVINPGSTSTKVALYKDVQEVDSKTLLHPADEIAKFEKINDQLDFRLRAVLDYLNELDFAPEQLSAIAARGGVIGEMQSGAYLVDDEFVRLSLSPKAQHAANLAPVIAHKIAQGAGINAYVYDMVCGCGTPEPIYKVSGSPQMERVFLTHVLNSRAVCIKQAAQDGKKLEDTTYIVTHMGGGITTNLIKGGKILDLVADDEGTLSPERAGGVPCRKLVKLCYSGEYTEQEAQLLLKGKGGMVAYLGTNDLVEVERRIDGGDMQAQLIFDAMILQISKDIASLFPSVCGEVDKILLTGGMAHSKRLTQGIIKRVSFLAPVSVMQGSFEMQALAGGILRVLKGEEDASTLAL